MYVVVACTADGSSFLGHCTTDGSCCKGNHVDLRLLGVAAEEGVGRAIIYLAHVYPTGWRLLTPYLCVPTGAISSLRGRSGAGPTPTCPANINRLAHRDLPPARARQTQHV